MKKRTSTEACSLLWLIMRMETGAPSSGIGEPLGCAALMPLSLSDGGGGSPLPGILQVAPASNPRRKIEESKRIGRRYPANGAGEHLMGSFYIAVLQGRFKINRRRMG